jgi:hypothetical protein
MSTELERTMRMLNGTVVLTVLVASLCLVGPAAQAGPLLQQYFPLQNGDQRTFGATVDGNAVQEIQTFTNVTFGGDDVFAGNVLDTYYGGPGATAYVTLFRRSIVMVRGFHKYLRRLLVGGHVDF